MKITLTEKGGFAPGVQRRPITMDLSSLSAEEADELKSMIATVRRTGPLHEEIDQGRDSMAYSLIIKDGASTTEIRQSDTNMTPEFAGLMQWLDEHRTAPGTT